MIYRYSKDLREKNINKEEERIKEKGRILVRLSGTEPLIRVMGESQDKKYLNETLDYLMDLIEKRFN